MEYMRSSYLENLVRETIHNLQEKTQLVIFSPYSVLYYHGVSIFAISYNSLNNPAGPWSASTAFPQHGSRTSLREIPQSSLLHQRRRGMRPDAQPERLRRDRFPALVSARPTTLEASCLCGHLALVHRVSCFVRDGRERGTERQLDGGSPA